jgi:hypothetical protein
VYSLFILLIQCKNYVSRLTLIRYSSSKCIDFLVSYREIINEIMSDVDFFRMATHLFPRSFETCSEMDVRGADNSKMLNGLKNVFKICVVVEIL